MRATKNGPRNENDLMSKAGHMTRLVWYCEMSENE